MLKSLLKRVFHLMQPRRAAHANLYPHRLGLAFLNRHFVDNSVSIHPRCGRYGGHGPRATCGDVEGVGQFERPGFESQAAHAAVMSRNRVQHFRDDDGLLTDRVQAGQQFFGLEIGQRQAEVGVVVVVNGDAQIVQGGGQHHHHFCVLVGEAVIGDDAGRVAGVAQQPQQSQGRIRHDPDVHFAVIAHAEAIHRVDIGTAPQLAQFLIGVDALDERLQARVVASRDSERRRCSRWSGHGEWGRSSSRLKRSVHRSPPNFWRLRMASR